MNMLWLEIHNQMRSLWKSDLYLHGPRHLPVLRAVALADARPGGAVGAAALGPGAELRQLHHRLVPAPVRTPDQPHPSLTAVTTSLLMTLIIDNDNTSLAWIRTGTQSIRHGRHADNSIFEFELWKLVGIF